MGRNPARPDLRGRIRRSDEEIRQLRIRGNWPPNMVDLSGYLNTGWAALEYFDSDGPFAVIYREGSRVWMAGSVFYADAGHVASGALIASGTPLPAEFRPSHSLTNVTFDFDWEETGWTPAPDGGSDATVGARIQADVTRDGYINFEDEIANYKGRATHGGTQYFGVPDGSTLILEGISWVASDPL